jgi:hypothetical protein
VGFAAMEAFSFLPPLATVKRMIKTKEALIPERKKSYRSLVCITEWKKDVPSTPRDQMLVASLSASF